MTFRNDRLFSLIALLFIASYLTYFLTKGVKIKSSKPSNISCWQFVRSLPVPLLNEENVDMYLIDTNALRKLLKNCSSSFHLPIAVMISEDNAGVSFNSSLYKVTIFADKGDFLQLNTIPERALLKQDYQRIGNLLVPIDMQKFIEFYDRSRLIPCLNKHMNRSNADSKQRLPASFENNLAVVRDALIDMGTLPYLTDETLLGWYRECSLIPYAVGAHFAVSRQEFRSDMTDHIKTLTGLKLNQQPGREIDSHKFTLHPQEGGSVDIFIVYDQDDDHVYTHGIEASTGKRVKWIVPRPKGFCSGILLGKLFFVPCNIEETIAVTFGITWGTDHPISQFNWTKPKQNAVEYGTFTKDEIKNYRRKH